MIAIFALSAAASLGVQTAAHADGLASLEKFMKTAKAGRAEFTQTVTAAPRADGKESKKVSTGTFAFQRPGHFRFDYVKPFEQTIVADGKTLWLHDADLNQVTARAQAQALANTPAAIISAAGDLNALKKDFVLTDDASKDGLQWVLAKPKRSDGTLKSIRAGFRDGASGPELVALDIEDGFQQRSLIQFKGFQTGGVSASTFQFKPPAGATVSRQ